MPKKRRYLDDNPPRIYYATRNYGFSPETSQTVTYTPTTTDVQKDIEENKPIGATTSRRIINASKSKPQASIKESDAPRGENSRANTEAGRRNNWLHPIAYGIDRAVDYANRQQWLPAHVALPIRDLNARIANVPSRNRTFIKNLWNGQNIADAWTNADINPNPNWTFVPQGLDDRHFTNAELAELYLRTQLSGGNPGQITARGNRLRNVQIDGDEHYAARISSRGFRSPDNVAEWAVGQTSGIEENGYPYLYDRYAFDLDDTYGVYKDPRGWIDSPMKGIRFVMGNLGSKGYPGNTQTSYSSIPIQISVQALERAWNNEQKARNSLKSLGFYRDGGRIYIKPENRGKFTALKERTGHSASWFKEHGTPAQKKMAVFALNSRKWKH